MLVDRINKETTDISRDVLDMTWWLDPGETITKVVSQTVILGAYGWSDAPYPLQGGDIPYDPFPLGIQSAVITPGGMQLEVFVNEGSAGLAYTCQFVLDGSSTRRVTIEMGVQVTGVPLGSLGSGPLPSYLAVTIADTPPSEPQPGQLWFDSVDPQLYIWYDDPSSSQWVIVAANVGGISTDAPSDGQLYGRQNGAWQSFGLGGPYLPISGGTVTGPLNVTVTGTPILRSVQDSFADAVSVKGFGAIMDGASHPLSTKYATLAAAQAVYPHAVALTDEIDWCAIQGAVNAGKGIYLPAGTAIINRPIVSSAVAATVAVHGAAQGGTVIVQTAAGVDGWQHSSSYSFHMFDLDLRCTGACGVALNLNFAGSATLCTLRGVSISGYTNTAVDYWHDGVVAIGCNRTSIERSLIAGIVGPLANVGNGLYLAPTTTPAVAGSFVISVQDTIINNYQSAIVLDSTGRNGNTNLQGVVLDWVNSNGCMQFITALGITLELVLHKCQAQTFGAIIHADNAQTVVVRDSYFILWAATANAIAAQLPQDVFYINGGGNWVFSDNRIVLSGGTVGFIINILGNAGGIYVRYNTVYVASGGVAAGFISVANGCHHCMENGTAFSFWNAAWPYFVNGNANGGTANFCSFGALSAQQTVPFAKDQWQNQGAYITWNYPAASGNMALFSSKGGAAGGFNFYNVASDPAQSPVLLASMLPAAVNFLLPTTVMGQGAAASGATIAAIDGAIGQSRILQLRSAGSARWNIFADNTAEGGSDAGSNLVIARQHDNGTTIGNALTINRATGQIVATAGLTVGSAAGPQLLPPVIGSPSGVVTAPRGSICPRTDGGVGTTLYVSQGGTVWNPVAGV